MDEKSIWEKFILWTKNSITLKLFMILFLVLILLIPVEAVRDLVAERSNRSLEVMNEISQKWGERQLIEGTVLVVPYKTNAKSTTIYESVFYPDQYNITGDLKSQTKQRGIYKTIVYTGEFELESKFLGLKKGTLPANYIFLWEDAYILLGLNNLGGVNGTIEANLNDKDYKLQVGLKTKATQYPNNPQTTKIFTTGFSGDVPLDKNKNQETENYTLNLKFKLNGGDELNFIPLAVDQTKINIQADWENPSFIGTTLPDTHEINQAGFSAEWSTNNYVNNGINQQFNQNFESKQFGVSLLPAVSHYQKITRAIKYSSLFLVLTFLLIMLFERITKIRIHVLQYILVGLAMILFYVLLLSVSEYLPFELTYLVASLATIGLIGIYSLSLFKKKLFSLILSLSLLGLYGFLFFLLQAQDYSLLVGSLSLFALLALFMYLTRNINESKENIHN